MGSVRRLGTTDGASQIYSRRDATGPSPPFLASLGTDLLSYLPRTCSFSKVEVVPRERRRPLAARGVAQDDPPVPVHPRRGTQGADQNAGQQEVDGHHGHQGREVDQE
jgi:hypothetical protein